MQATESQYAQVHGSGSGAVGMTSPKNPQTVVKTQNPKQEPLVKSLKPSMSNSVSGDGGLKVRVEVAQQLDCSAGEDSCREGVAAGRRYSPLRIKILN